jgi:hypothetical protein
MIYDDINNELNGFQERKRMEINRLVVDKLKTLGITLEDLKQDKDKFSPVNALNYEEGKVTEQYDVMGIHLLTVEWEGIDCRIIHPEIDETAY